MTELIRTLAVRVFTGGIICSAAMIVAGDGAKKEVVRICCACLMVIFVLSPIKNVSFSLAELTGGAKDAEEQIDGALARSREYERNAVASAVSQYIREQAANIGIECSADIDYYIDEQNIFRITAVSVGCGELDSAKREQLIQIITQGCGVSVDQITFLEG